MFTPICLTTFEAWALANSIDLIILSVSKYFTTNAAINESPAPDESFTSTNSTG